MTFNFYSDLHIDDRVNTCILFGLEPDVALTLTLKDLIEFNSKTIVLAGDIADFKIYKLFKIIETICKLNYPNKVIFVPGNHEYYYSTFKNTNKYFAKLSEQIENLEFLNNSMTEVDSIHFYGGTLWGNFNDIDDNFLTKYPINDFYFLTDMKIFKDSQQEFLTNLKSFNDLDVPSENKIIVTHVPPVPALKNPNFNNERDRYFTADLDLSGIDAKTWIYGHTHSNISTQIDGINFLSNQKGYRHENI